MTTEKQFKQVHMWKIDWFKNVDEGGGAQDHVILNMKTGTFPIKSWTRSEGQMWAAVTPQQLANLLKRNRGVYEVLQASFKRKVYFDIDDKNPAPLGEIKKIILDRFPGARMHISGREGSWHIVLSNYYAVNLEVTRNTNRRFAMLHVDKGFDKLPYGNNQNFKCINQSKQGGKVQAYIEGDKSLSKHLIHHDFDDDAIDVQTIDFGFEKEIETNTKRKGKKENVTLDILAIPQHDLPVPKNFDKLTATPRDWLAIIPNPPRGEKGAHDHELCWQVMTWCKMVGIPFEDFWAWNRRKDRSIARYKKYLASWQKDKYKIKRKFIEVLAERYYPKITESPSTQRFRKQFDFEEVELFDGQYLHKNHIAKGNKAVGASKPVPGCFNVTDKGKRRKHSLLVGHMGSGKTKATIEYLLSNLKPGQRVLWLTPRITLSNNTRKRLLDMGINAVNYKDYKAVEKAGGVLDEADFVICSIQSLHYLSKEFTYVVIDEIETVLHTFSDNAKTHHGRTYNNLKTNWEMFLILLESAGKVLYLDAFTTNLTLNFVKGIIRKSDPHLNLHYEIIKTKDQPPPRTFLVVPPKKGAFDVWMTLILDALKNGKKLYVFTPYRDGKQGVEWITEKIKTYFGWEENKQVLCYHSTREEEKKKLYEVEEVWKQDSVRCVVTNGAISVGVNFDVKDCFDQVFAHYSNLISVRDFFQALYRVRHPKSTEMILVRTRMPKYGEENTVTHPDCDIYRQMREDLAIEQVANNNYAKWQTFNMMCEMTGVELKPMNIDVAIASNEQYLEHLESLVSLVFSWDRIADIRDHTEYEKKVFKSYDNSATLDDRLEVEKYIFRNFKFPPGSDEQVMATVWQTKKDFPDKVHILYQEPDHLINRFLQEQGLDINKDDLSLLPPNMTTKIPVDDIRRMYNFPEAIRNFKSGIVSQMLNAFFEMKAYAIPKVKRKRGDDDEEDGKMEGKRVSKKRIAAGEGGERKQEYVYVSTDIYSDLMSACQPLCKPREVVSRLKPTIQDIEEPTDVGEDDIMETDEDVEDVETCSSQEVCEESEEEEDEEEWRGLCAAALDDYVHNR